jgi:hypothetical protein
MNEDELGNACSMHGEKSNAYRVLMGKRPLRKSRSRCEYKIKMDLGEMGWGSIGASGGGFHEKLESSSVAAQACPSS